MYDEYEITFYNSKFVVICCNSKKKSRAAAEEEGDDQEEQQGYKPMMKSMPTTCNPLPFKMKVNVDGQLHGCAGWTTH